MDRGLVGYARTVLGVNPRASRVEIDVAFRCLAKRNHPDLGGSAGAMHRLLQARRVLFAAMSMQDAVAA